MKRRPAVVDWRYGLVTLVWMAGIYALSSRSDLGSDGKDQVVATASNLAHLPLFAGLAWCWFMTLAGMPHGSPQRLALAFLASTAWAAADEWHQAFVPGRIASAADFVVDVAAIAGMLLVLRLTAPEGIRES